MNLFQVVTFGITSAGFINCLVFCIAYAIVTRSAWWRGKEGHPNEYGRFLMLFMGSLGSLFGLIVCARLFGDWPGRQIVTTMLYVGFVAASVWPTRLLWLSVSRKRPLPAGRQHEEGSESDEI